MKVFLHHKDIVDVTEADTIVLPVDGGGPGMEGNVARRFMRHVEVDEMDDLFDLPLRYPFNGRCHFSETNDLDNTHFEYVCALGILSHAPDVDHRALMRSALYAMFQEGKEGMGTRFASPVLSGGWRLKAMEAIYIMLAEADRFTDPTLELHIAERDAARYQLLRTIIP